jgi:hypothetical protein
MPMTDKDQHRKILEFYFFDGEFEFARVKTPTCSGYHHTGVIGIEKVDCGMIDSIVKFLMENKE